MYSNNIVNFQESTTILNACTKKSGNLLNAPHSSFVNKMYLLLLIWLIGLVGRVFTNGPGDLGSIPGRIIPKTFKMVLDTSLLNTQHYKVRIEGKVEQSRERSGVLLYALVW